MTFIRLETPQSSASERQWYMPKTAAIHYLNVYQSGKSRSRWAKRLQQLPQNCHSAKYERARHFVFAKFKPQGHKVRVIYPLRPFRAVWLHDNEIWAY